MYILKLAIKSVLKCKDNSLIQEHRQYRIVVCYDLKKNQYRTHPLSVEDKSRQHVINATKENNYNYSDTTWNPKR